MRLENFTDAKCLGFGFGTLLILLNLVAGLGMHGLRGTDQSSSQTSKANITQIAQLSDMSEASNVVSRVISTIASLQDESEFAQQREKIAEARFQYDQAFESLQKMPLDNISKAFVEKVHAYATAARESNSKFLAMNKSSPDDAFKLLITESIPLNAAWQTAIHEFIDYQKNQKHRDEIVATAN